MQDKAIVSHFSFDDQKFQPPVDGTKDFFYIAVSKNADISELRKKLLKSIATILSKHKKQQRARQNEWKYYLIVYDFKQKFKDKISYDEITDILIEAYREDSISFLEENRRMLFESRKINYWHKNAIALIDGDFTKHVKHKTYPRTK